MHKIPRCLLNGPALLVNRCCFRLHGGQHERSLVVQDGAWIINDTVDWTEMGAVKWQQMVFPHSLGILPVRSRSTTLLHVPDLYWLSRCFWAQFTILVLIFQIWKGLGQADMKDRLSSTLSSLSANICRSSPVLCAPTFRGEEDGEERQGLFLGGGGSPHFWSAWFAWCLLYLT